MRKRLSTDVAIALGFLALAILFYLPVTLGGRTLLPADIALHWEPWATALQRPSEVPGNSLLGDLYVQNLPWKTLIVESLRAREIPLWNPYILSGVPFLAAGQHSALYPLSLIYYLLPLPLAYGWFAALHLWLAGLFTYLFVRTLRGQDGEPLSRFAGVVAGVAFMLGGFITSHVVFPMMVGAAVWLPLLLLTIERLAQRFLRARESGATHGILLASIPDMAVGTLAVGMAFLAGHPEMYYYVGLTAAAYSVWRLAAVVRARGPESNGWRSGLALGAMLVAMALLGIGLGAAQWIPLLELVQVNWRQGGATFQEVQGWAWPFRRALALIIPDLYGNPAHHTWFNLFSGKVEPVTVNALGNAITTTEWGIKNYVEGSGYLGTLPLLLAAIAVLRRQKGAGFFAFWAVLSLLFVFGTPLYYLVYRLPGFSQVHTPFRWIYPWSLCTAVLAGMGAEALRVAGYRLHVTDRRLQIGNASDCKGQIGRLQNGKPGEQVSPRDERAPDGAPALAGDPIGSEAYGAGDGAPALAGRLARILDWLASAVPWAALLSGVGILGALGLSLAFKERAAALAGAVMQRLARAPEAFADGRMFYAYQARNLLILGLALAASGLLLILLRRATERRRLAQAGLVAVLAAELFVIGFGFYPRADASLVAAPVPALEWLSQQAGPFRIAAYGDDSLLPPNTAMLYGLEDIRGYDSIIPRQYVQFMERAYPQWGLAYNRINAIPAQTPDALDSPLLDMLNVRYVLSKVPIERPGYALVYDGEILIYENLDALPRAYTVPHARVIADEGERLAALATLDPRREVIIEQPLDDPLPEEAPADYPLAAESIVHGANEVFITVDLPAPGVLILADSYFDGWVAFIRPAALAEGRSLTDLGQSETDPPIPDQSETDPPEDADLEGAEQALTLYRANGNFRAVQVPAGRHVVRMKYSPDAVKFGLYLSFMSAVVVGLALGYRWWARRAHSGEAQSTAQRVTKNTVAPIALNLINKVIDMVFAMLMLRILGPVQSGQYYLAIVIIGWFDIWINFGLNTLATREVARDRDQANRYLSNTVILRSALWLGSFPLLALFFAFRQGTQPLDGATMLAIGLFLAGLLPSNLSASLTANFNAWERMEVPASVTTITTLLKVFLGTVALLANTGFVGLAAVSILVNLITLAVLYALHRRQLFAPRFECDWRFQREMLGVSWPLMVNLLLATLFFKVAVILLEWLLPDPRVLGWYSTAYKYIDAVGVVPAFFTMAIFPLMSRYAATAKGQLLKAYELAIKLLVMFAIPMGVLISALSTELVALLGGSQYLPQAADILRVMIWYMPFGFINSVTQYVLIALGQQRYLTRAFAIGLAFNVIANVVLITRVGFMASAWVAIFSELALLIPFYVGVRRNLAPIPWVRLLWRPAASALPMILMFWLLPGRWSLLAIPLGGALYLALLYALGALNAEERAIARRALPIKR